jgi:hypothetical protein
MSSIVVTITIIVVVIVVVVGGVRVITSPQRVADQQPAHYDAECTACA